MIEEKQYEEDIALAFKEADEWKTKYEQRETVVNQLFDITHALIEKDLHATFGGIWNTLSNETKNELIDAEFFELLPTHKYQFKHERKHQWK